MDCAQTTERMQIKMVQNTSYCGLGGNIFTAHCSDCSVQFKFNPIKIKMTTRMHLQQVTAVHSATNVVLGVVNGFIFYIIKQSSRIVNFFQLTKCTKVFLFIFACELNNFSN